MGPEEKVRENRLRREAMSLGYAFIKQSLRRHPVTAKRFQYWLISWHSMKANTFEHLDEIAEFLEKEDS